jgi:hypothetical protein
VEHLTLLVGKKSVALALIRHFGSLDHIIVGQSFESRPGYIDVATPRIAARMPMIFARRFPRLSPFPENIEGFP